MGILFFFLSMLVIALLIVLFSHITSLRKNVDVLRLEVADLRSRVEGSHRETTIPAVAPLPSPAAKAPAEPGRQPSAPRPAPSRTREEWEALIGGKLLNRIGALALIIGVGFFLKYAFDNNWISESVRVSIGALFGLSLLVVAAKAHAKQFEVFAQGLVGAGIAILYISVYASFNFYRLVPQSIAFVLMGAVTIIAFTQSFKYDSLAVSLLGLAGGFMTPFLLSTGQANTIGLFSYIVLLVAGMLTIVYSRPAWYVLQPLTAAGTAGVYLAWYRTQYTANEFGLAVSFLTVLWLLFFLFDIVAEASGQHPRTKLPPIVAAAVAVAVQWMVMVLLTPAHESWQGASTFFLALIYFGAATFVRRGHRDSTLGWTMQGLISVYFVAAGIGIQFHGDWILIGWAIAAIAILQIAARAEAPSIAGIVLLLPTMNAAYLVARSLLGEPADWGHYRPLLSERTLAFVATIASIAMASRTFRSNRKPWAGRVSQALAYAWPILLFILLTVETNDLFRFREWSGEGQDLLDFQRWLAMSLVWMTYGTVLTWAGKRLQGSALPAIGAAGILLGMALAFGRGFLAAPLATYSPLLNERVLVLLLVAGLGTLSFSFFGTAHRSRATAWIPGSIRIGVALLFLSLATGEVRDAFERVIVSLKASSGDQSAALLHLQNLQQLSLSGVWLLFSIIVMVTGLARRTRSYRILAIVIFGITILKIFFYDLSFLETLYRIFSFIALGLILLATSYLYQRNKDVILGRPE